MTKLFLNLFFIALVVLAVGNAHSGASAAPTVTAKAAATTQPAATKAPSPSPSICADYIPPTAHRETGCYIGDQSGTCCAVGVCITKVSMATSSAHCGGCNSPCNGTNQSCVNYQCLNQCADGTQCLNGSQNLCCPTSHTNLNATTCVDTNTGTNIGAYPQAIYINCGGCSDGPKSRYNCLAGQVCTGGVCANP